MLQSGEAHRAACLHEKRMYSAAERSDRLAEEADALEAMIAVLVREHTLKEPA